MSYPTIDIDQKKIILLSGFERACGANKPFSITAKNSLRKQPKRHRDAVAFGYVLGCYRLHRWSCLYPI